MKKGEIERVEERERERERKGEGKREQRERGRVGGERGTEGAARVLQSTQSVCLQPSLSLLCAFPHRGWAQGVDLQ